MRNPIISPSLIRLDLTLNDKNDVIEAIAQSAFDNGYLSDLNDFVRAVKAREKNASTAVGYHVAMPHGKSDTVLHPFIAFARMAVPFLWDGKEEVTLIFMIGVPETENRLHLKFISQLSKALLDDDYRNSLLKLNDITEVAKQLDTIEI